MKTTELIKAHNLSATFNKKTNILEINGVGLINPLKPNSNDLRFTFKINYFPNWSPIYIGGNLYDIILEEGNGNYSLHVYGLQSHEDPNDNKAEIELTITE